MKVFVSVLAGLCLAGCAAPRQGTGLRGGYTYAGLGHGVFEVRTLINGDRSVVQQSVVQRQDFVVLRSAEIALQHGYRYFTIYDRDKQGPRTHAAAPANAPTESPAGKNSQSLLTIKCFKRRPVGYGYYYDASSVCRVIGSIYQMHCVRGRTSPSL